MAVEIQTPDGTKVMIGDGQSQTPIQTTPPTNVVKATWTTAYVNSLPDANFLYIEAGGKKDADGKTTPRSLRHFPVRDENGKLDLPHVKNALSRIPQSSLPQDVKDRCSAKAKRLLEQANKGGDEQVRVSFPSRTIKLAEPEGSKLHYVMNVVLEPCTKDATKDTQGDFYDAEDIWEARRTFMQKQALGVLHSNPDVRGITLLDNFIAWADLTIEGQTVTKGSWLIGAEIDEEQNPDAWAGVLKGDLLAFSIEGEGVRDIVGAEAA